MYVGITLLFLIYICLAMFGVKSISICLFATWTSSLVKCLVRSLIYFLITLFAFLLLSFQDSLHIFLFIFVYWGFPDSSVGKESTCSAGDLGSIPGLGRSPGEGKGYPLQYSGLENSMDCIVHGVARSQTWPSNFHLYILDNLPLPAICHLLGIL